MAFRTIAGLAAALLFSINTWADVLEINPQHPEQYTVVQNDTLWDISAKFLKSPWKWPSLWHGNPQIKNPNLIYPGDTLVFSMVNGKPSLRLSSRDVKLHPGIRKESLDQEIKMIPTDAIAQFLSSPKVLDSDELGQAPYIIDFAEEHLLVGAGSRVYVRSIQNAQTLDYTVYRKGKAYLSPETGEFLGYEALHIADASLQKEGDPATLLITKAQQEVLIGDRLMANSEKTTPLNFFPKPAEAQIYATIISVLNGVSQIGRYNIVVVDKGLQDGLKIGDLLTIYQRGKIVNDRFKSKDEVVMVKLPNEIAGTLMVFRPFNRVSYALVMEAKQAIHVLDKVATPEQD